MTTEQQKATLPTGKQISNAKNYNGQKELIQRYQCVAYRDSANSDDHWLILIDCRIYMSYRSDGASPMYASIWIGDRQTQTYLSGTGKASGYGYHKTSAAVQDALDSAGVKLALPIDGRGDSAVRDALQAICGALGYTDIAILE